MLHTHPPSRFFPSFVAALLTLLSACEPGPRPFPPERARLEASTVRGVAGQPLRFKCVAEDPQGLELSYSFNWGNGVGLDEWTEPLRGGVEREHTFAVPGTYAVGCRARNTAGIGPTSEFLAVTIAPRSITLTQGVEGEGTVSSSPAGIDCGTQCSAVFDEGTKLTLTAKPAAGWLFAGWTGSCSGTETTAVFQVSPGVTCLARFIPNPVRYKLELQLLGGGRVTSTPAGLDCTSDCVVLLPGGEVSLHAEPLAGWRFAGWLGNCVSASTAGAETRFILDRNNETCWAQFLPTVIAAESWRRVGARGPRSVVWSPDGTRVAAAMGDTGTVAIWDVATGALSRFLPILPSKVLSVAWSPDGTQVATGGTDSRVIIWDASTGERVRTFTTWGEGVSALDWSPDGNMLIGSDEQGLNMWNLSLGNNLHDPWGNGIDRFQRSPDGKWLALESWGGDVRFLGMDGSRSTPFAKGRGFAWSPREDVYALGNGRTITVHQRADGALLRTLNTPLANAITTLSWSADGRYLAATDFFQTVVLDAATGELVSGPLDTGSLELAFHPSRSALLVSHHGALSVVDPSGLATERDLELFQLRPTQVAWSPDGKMLAMASEDGRVWLWSSAGVWLGVLSGSAKVNAVAWDPTSTWLAVGCEDGSVRRWRAVGGEELAGTWALGNPVTRVAWSPNGASVAAAGRQGRLGVWNVDSGETRALREAHTGSVRALTWSPDGSLLLTGGEDRIASLWDALTGEPRGSFPDQGRAVEAAVWSPDGKRVALSGEARSGGGAVWGNVWLYEASTKAELGPLPGAASCSTPVDSITGLAWDPSGELLAGSCGDGSFILWNTDSRTLLRTRTSAHTRTLGVAWSPEGNTLVTWGTDTGVVTWRVTR